MKKLSLSLLILAMALMPTFSMEGVTLAKPPPGDAFGLSKGNKTIEVPANVWNGMHFFNTAGTGYVTKAEILVNDANPTGAVRMAIYESTPCILMRDLGYVPVVDGWVSIEGLRGFNIKVIAEKDYFLAFDLQAPNGIKMQTETPDIMWSAPYPYDAPLAILNQATDIPAPGVLSHCQYVMRVTVSP